ncbi:MAG: class I mannose-6-phosphate isomerase, partial [Chloroflexia bacterium]
MLFKFIDAGDFLSVQVHPDDEYAREHTDDRRGKSEAWYIISAEPGAQIVHGWRRPTGPEQVATAVEDGRLEGLLQYIDVAPGDVVYVPAETVHAIGGGIVLAEIQQSSDVTYRLYDWNRPGSDGEPRELHVEESLATLNYESTLQHKTPALPISSSGMERRYLTACRYFVLESLTGDGVVSFNLDGSRFEIVSLLEGDATLEWEHGSLELGKGRTVLLPAALGEWRLLPTGKCSALRMYPP